MGFVQQVEDSPGTEHGAVKTARIRSEQGETTGADTTMRILLLLVFGAVCFAIALNANDSTLLKPVMLILGTVLLLSVGLFLSMRSPAFTFAIGPLHLLAAAFLAASALSIAGAVNTGRSMEALIHLSCYLVAFAVAASYASSPAGIRVLLQGMALIAAAAVMIGLFQHWSPDTLFQSVVSQERSVLSTFCNAMYFGGFLVLMLPLVLALVRNASPGSLRRLLLGVLSLAIIYCIIITESRSAWVGAIAGIMVFGLLSVSSLKARLVVVGVIAGGLVIAYFGLHEIFERRFGELIYGGSTSSFSRRVLFYQAAWNAFLHSPIIGNGIGNFAFFAPLFRSPHYWMSRSEDIVPHAHNEFLQILAESGILGFLAFIALISFFAVAAVRSLRSASAELRIVHTGFLASVAGVLVDNLASIDLRTFPVALGFWIVLGLSAGQMKPLFTLHFPIRFPLRRFAWLPLAGCVLFFFWFVRFSTVRYNGEKLLLEANTHHYQGNKAASVATYRETLRSLPENPEALIYFANDLLPANPAEARQSLLRLLEIHPYYPKARILLAVASLSLGDTANAFREIDRELLVEDSPDAVYYAASLAYRARKTDLEFRYLKRLFANAATARRYDHVPVSLERLTQSLSRGTVAPDFLPVLDSLNSAFADDPDILVPLAEAFFAMGQKSRGMETARRARTLPSVRENHLPRISKLLGEPAIR